ncbi:MAG: single-stranded-DNA-specific exonuclease [Parcubacteria group bacterium Gr01-1014_30]|nr:MAG: single-stranded-DNA-specific exonuclease [Parcubacteria group bacterium Gr01-1014_30]
MEIKNLKRAAQRISKAIKNKERIILYGDADLDGTASVIILKETIANLGGEVAAVYFPDREKEGYGLNSSALEHLRKFSPALLILLDCGISNFEETEAAKKLGFEVAIIDHHVPLEKLPKAKIVVDPKQKGDKGFKDYAAAGLAFKLSEALLKEKLGDSLKGNFLELAALATIADMMPETDENKLIVDEGIFHLEQTFRPGLRVFLDADEIKNMGDVRQRTQEIISFLNIVDPTQDHLNGTYLILSASSVDEARSLLSGLAAKREEKRAQVREVTSQVQEKVVQKPEQKIVFEGGSFWPVALLGSVASRICSSQGKPTFIFSQKSQESRGAVRTGSDVDAVELMKKCAKHLLGFGGHPRAAGFLVKNENLEEFKQCLLRNYEIFTKVRKNK